MDDYELDASELTPPKPYTPERAEEIAELMSEISSIYNDIMAQDGVKYNKEFAE